MKNYPVSQPHSQYIARWRLYLWFHFLETGDDSQFIIPEDIKMAKKAKHRMNRMEVVWHIASISNAAEPLPGLVKDGMATATAMAMLRTKSKVDNDSFKAVMNITKEPIPAMHYASINDQNEIEVLSQDGSRAITGADILSMFNQASNKKMKYDDKYVTAQKDSSGYCCLYFIDKNNQLKPIKGIEAKIIGAQVMAEAAKFKFKQLKESTVMLIQGYKTDGTPDSIAEYYTKDLNTSGHLEKPALNYRAQSRKDICRPLYDMLNDIRVGNFTPHGIRSEAAVDFIEKIINLIAKSPLDDDKLIHKVKKYENTIRCLFSQVKDPSYKKYFLPYRENRKLFFNTMLQYKKEDPWQKIDDELLRHKHQPSVPDETLNDKRSFYNKRINSRLKALSSHMDNTEISVDLISGEALQNRVEKDPEFVKMQRAQGPFIFNPDEKSNHYTITNIDHFISSNDKLKVEDGCITLDMIFPHELIVSSSSNSGVIKKKKMMLPVSPGLRDKNKADDAYSIADNIIFKINSALADCGCNILNKESISKLAYLVMVGACFQGSYQSIGLSKAIFDTASLETSDPTLIDSQNIYKYISIHVNEKGDAEIRITWICRLLLVDAGVRIPISDRVAVQSIIKVNLSDVNPKFTMTQRGVIKPTDDLRPESFFSEEPTPRPSFLGRYFGYPK